MKFEITIRQEKITKHIIEVEDENCVIEEASSLTAEELAECQTEVVHSYWHVEEFGPFV